MSLTHTQSIIATAQCMTDTDAIDFITEYVSVDDLVEWIEDSSSAEMPTFCVHGFVPKVDR